MEIKNNPMPTRIIALVAGLLINALGNGLTITSNFGSGIWTTAAVNLSFLTHWSLAGVIFGYAVVAVIINQILIKHFDFKRTVGELIYAFFFGYFIELFTILLAKLGLGQLSTPLRLIEVCLGVSLICIAISLYQRANIFMHPIDDMSNLIRFKIFKGNSVVAQLVSMSIPVIIILICFFITHQFQALGIGTIMSIFCNSFFIRYADQYILPNLNHNFNKSDNM